MVTPHTRREALSQPDEPLDERSGLVFVVPLLDEKQRRLVAGAMACFIGVRLRWRD
jgi:hypothetical protein